MRTPSPALMYPTAEAVTVPFPSTPKRPCTPPRKPTTSGTANHTLQLSPQRTPLSHRGLHMSPSPSLVHYKSNLDPPPAAVFLPQAPLLSSLSAPDDPSLTLPNPENLRTPSRRHTPKQGGSGPHNAIGFSPFTPKRLIFGSITDSPFRTPSSGILDPYNPSTLLEEEAMRLATQEQLGLQDSPTSSLFSKQSIFESPSPSRWDRW